MIIQLDGAETFLRS